MSRRGEARRIVAGAWLLAALAAGVPHTHAQSAAAPATQDPAQAQGAAPARAPMQRAGSKSPIRPWADIGRPATSAELRAWDIDVRPDLAGLPAGAGSVEQGQEIWDGKCASCHGTFGESNDVFAPIVGGTTPRDIETGRTANLARADFPQRTSMMKLSQVSTLWDYIRRAMPWNAPKSLSVEEVYAVTAYILNLADIVPADFVLSDRNMLDVQRRLPNRDGMVRHDGLWRVDGKPDVQGDACMRDCAVAITGMQPHSSLPSHARDSHGNLAGQHRLVGPARGADTTRPALPHPPGAGSSRTVDAAQQESRGSAAADLARDERP